MYYDIYIIYWCKMLGLVVEWDIEFIVFCYVKRLGFVIVYILIVDWKILGLVLK